MFEGVNQEIMMKIIYIFTKQKYSRNAVIFN